MADYKILKPFILAWEGGFVNDKHDTGGATNMGVTIGTYKLYCRKKGYPVPTVERLKALDDKTWTDIYKTMFWDKCRGDEIQNQNVANLLVDFYWHSGTYATKFIQGIVGTTADGIIGSKSIAAINAMDARRLFEEYKVVRLEWLRKRANAWKYFKGWSNRVNGIEWNRLSADGEVLWQG